MSNTRTGRTAADYKALRHKAAVLYIKHGLSETIVSKELRISIAVVQKWRKEGLWDELRPDMEIIKQFHAVQMYVRDGMSMADISQKLSVPKVELEIWALLNGWDVMRVAEQTRNDIYQIVSDFCQFFIKKYPKHMSLVMMMLNRYKMQRIRKNYNPFNRHGIKFNNDVQGH